MGKGKQAKEAKFREQQQQQQQRAGSAGSRRRPPSASVSAYGSGSVGGPGSMMAHSSVQDSPLQSPGNSRSRSDVPCSPLPTDSGTSRVNLAQWVTAPEPIMKAGKAAPHATEVGTTRSRPNSAPVGRVPAGGARAAIMAKKQQQPRQAKSKGIAGSSTMRAGSGAGRSARPMSANPSSTQRRTTAF